MALDERDRHDLCDAARACLGDPAAATLMALLPPAGWDDVATRGDLDVRFDALDYRFQSLEYRFQALDARIDAAKSDVLAVFHQEIGLLRSDQAQQTRTLVLSFLGAQVALGSLALGLSRLLV